MDGIRRRDRHVNAALARRLTVETLARRFAALSERETFPPDGMGSRMDTRGQLVRFATDEVLLLSDTSNLCWRNTSRAALSTAAAAGHVCGPENNIHRIQAHDVTSMACNADVALVGTERCELRVLPNDRPPANLNQATSLQGLISPVRTCALDTTGRLAIGSCMANCAMIWSHRETPHPTLRFLVPDNVLSACFGPEQHQLIVCTPNVAHFIDTRLFTFDNFPRMIVHSFGYCAPGQPRPKSVFDRQRGVYTQPFLGVFA
jgi:hypothetical protein